MEFPVVYCSNSYDETFVIGQNFAKLISNYNYQNITIALFGDLGAGKTSFVKGFCNELVPNINVYSPTYSVVNEYVNSNYHICHFDMYRITNEDDLYSIGFYDYTDCISLIEWSENIINFLPEKYFKITINKCETDNKRVIKFERIG